MIVIKWAQNFCWIKDFSIKISLVQPGWVLFQFVKLFPYLEFIVYGQQCAKKCISISKCEIRKQNQSANMLGNILLTDRSWYGILHYWASRLSERYKQGFYLWDWALDEHFKPSELERTVNVWEIDFIFY